MQFQAVFSYFYFKFLNCAKMTDCPGTKMWHVDRPRLESVM